VPSPYTAEDARSYVEEVSPQGWQDGTTASFAVLDATTGRLLGSIALMGIADGSAEIGYWTASEARGRGVTTDAVGAVCRWGFAALDLQRVSWRAGAGNHGSRAVAERCGFTVEGRLRLAHPRPDGTRHDEWHGSLLATDEVRDRRVFGSWRDRSGEGLTLRRWRDDDADAAALLEGASDPETARWVPVPVPYTAETARWYLSEQYPRQWSEGVAASLAVEQDGRVVGLAVLMAATARHSPEAGWWTLPSARGRGIADRAARPAGRLGRRAGAHPAGGEGGRRQPRLVAGGRAGGLPARGGLRGAGRDRQGRPRDFVLHARTLSGSAGAPAAGSGDLEQLLPDGVDDGLHPGVQLQLLQDVADVVLHGVLADEQLLGDVAVVHALGHQLEDLHLAVGEPRGGDLLTVVGLLDHGGELGEQLAGHRGLISDCPRARRGSPRRPPRWRSP
jgi:RimJ/RimL family protein N-acetyltransferase